MAVSVTHKARLRLDVEERPVVQFLEQVRIDAALRAGKLEDALYWQLVERTSVNFSRQFPFAFPRKWAADFAYPTRRVLIEVEGGEYIRGRHVQPVGFGKDCEKYNEAAIRGWIVIRVTRQHIKSGVAIRWIERALEVRK